MCHSNSNSVFKKPIQLSANSEFTFLIQLRFDSNSNSDADRFSSELSLRIDMNPFSVIVLILILFIGFYFNRSRLHLTSVIFDTISLIKRLRWGRIKIPLCEKTRSTEADVAGTDNTLIPSRCKCRY